MIMEIQLKQYLCNDCGKLSDVLDIDEDWPIGWISTSNNTHYCDKCASKHEYESAYKYED